MGASGHCVRIGLMAGDSTATPVSKCIISGNVFKDTLHVGVTCELHASSLVITGNEFDSLNQAIKAESAGDTVFDIVFSDNIVRNIAGETAFNLGVHEVTFSNNRCYDCAGGPAFSNDFIANGNYFDGCGSASAAVITASGGAVRGVVSNNVIKDAPYIGIEISGNSTVVGNTIINTSNAAIRATGAGNVVCGNIVDGCVYGFSSNSTLTESVVKDNVGRNISSSGFSGISYNSAFSTVLIKDNVGFGEITHINTIVAGEIVVSYTDAGVIVDTEAAAAADDLTTISGGKPGQRIVLRTASVSRDVTVKDSTGNIRLAGDMLLDTTSDTLTLQYDSSLGWVELARSNNA